MKVIICIDNNMGMLFNNRRQSSDKLLIRHILTLTGKSRLFINSFSEDIIKGDFAICDDNFLINCPKGDYCFVENADISPYEEKISGLILCCWNRTYPADFYLKTDLSKWRLISEQDIAGYSHKKITIKTYTKQQRRE